MRGLPCLLALALLAGCQKPAPRVVLYCAQDKEFAEQLLADFAKETGIQVDAKYDTEATKSVSLYQSLLREKAQPRCDVFWNNEILLTLKLDADGLLAPYASPAAAAYPAWTQSPKQTWQAFAARARILIVNDQVPEAERPKSVAELGEPKWKGKAAMAKPLFGTTAAHMACLAASLGDEKAGALFAKLKENVEVLAGNKDVAEAVSSGRYLVGLTDTDDAIVEKERGKPVTLIFPDKAGLGTLFLPNTVSLIQGAPNPDAGKKLVDYLLSPAVERRLADGPSAQLPLGPAGGGKRVPRFPAMGEPMEVDFAAAAAGWEKTQTKLRDLFAR